MSESIENDIDKIANHPFLKIINLILIGYAIYKLVKK